MGSTWVPYSVKIVCINKVFNIFFQHDNLFRLRRLVGEVDWPHGLMVWRKFFSFEHPIADVPETITDDFGEVTEPAPRQSKHEGSRRARKKKNKKKQGFSTENELNADSVVVNSELHKDKEISITESNAHTHEAETGIICSKRDTEVNETNISLLNENQTDCSNQTDDVKRTDNTNNATESEANSELKKPRTRLNPWNPMKPAFRVTCNRVGEHHNFDSMTAAANFGGAIYRYFGWNVEMKNFDIEVMLNIEDEEVTVGIGLTRESLHRRDIGHFGPTTLRPTLAYNMLRYGRKGWI